jgi:fucose permease
VCPGGQDRLSCQSTTGSPGAASCIPYIIALGDESTATQRLNLAQSFNSIGSNIGVFLAATFILPKVNPATDAEREALAVTDSAALEAIQREELTALMGPYVTMAGVLLILWVAISLTRMPVASDPSMRIDFLPTLRRLFRNSHYAFVVPGLSGLWAIVCISACMSLMFPTIYGIALQGLGPDAKIGAAGLVMAILGGALFPLGQARIIDTVSANASYIVPFVCFVVVAAYAVFDLRKLRIAHAS